MKWTPDDIDIPTIASYAADRKNELEYRKKYIDNLVKNLNAGKITSHPLQVGNFSYRQINFWNR